MSESSFDRPVVHLSTAKTWRGGEQQALYLAQGLHRRGTPVTIIARPGGPLAQRAKDAGLPIEEIGACCEFDPLAMWKIAGVLKRTKAALLHAHDAHSVTLAAGATWLAKGVTPIATRRVDFAVNKPGKYARMAKVICISDAIRRICQDGGVPEEKLTVVHSGIDLSRVTDIKVKREDVRAELGEEKKKRLFVLNVASLVDHKDQMTLLEGFAESLRAVPQGMLLIAGEGELERDLKQRAKILALDEDVCQFLGFREDVPHLLHAADLFVMSSHLEGLCTSVMDAMAAGLAVVATRAGGLPELVEDGTTGRLVPPKDPQALAEALTDLLKDRKKRERFGRNAAEEARRRFGVDTMVEGTVAAYREVCPAL